jgi:hypothetical protein
MAARPHGSQVTECSLVVAIPAGGGAEEGKSFAVQLSNAQGGAQLSKRCRCIVTFSSDDEVTEMTNKLLTQLKDRMNIFKVRTVMLIGSESHEYGWTRVGDERRFTTPAQSLYHNCNPCRGLHAHRESEGVVNDSRGVFSVAH